jgi:hypothetical protein
VRVFDYVDKAVPQLATMFSKRLRGYRSIGYQDGDLPAKFEMLTDEWSSGFPGFDDDIEAAFE